VIPSGELVMKSVDEDDTPGSMVFKIGSPVEAVAVS
jgi:hypothetical protein